MNDRPAFLGLVPALLLSSAAWAQAAPEVQSLPSPPSSAADNRAELAHPDPDQAIVVTGVRRAARDVLGSVKVLDKEALTKDLRPSIGDTLAKLPGVSASSFGPTASRPVLRGLSGERVRVLTNGIGSLDLSASDPDHAVAINPLTAERIEVLRGPSSLLYGSSAIGGVVNVVDGRIPRHAPDGGISGDLLVNYGSAANERSVNAQANAALTDHLVAHIDGTYSKYDDLGIGGYVLAEPLRREALASPDPEIRALADLKGKLPNSAGRSDDVAAGIAYVDGPLNVGFSLAHRDARYQVPVRYSLDPGVEVEKPTIDAHQNRADIRAEVPMAGAFRSINLRAGASRYRHAEIEEDGAIGSRFFSNGQEGRFELVQADRSGWAGTSGVQYLNQSARIEGEEKYLPPSRNRQTGLFTLQTLARGPLRAEAGGRIEFARLSARPDADLADGEEGDPRIGVIDISRKFTPLSASVGANYDVGGGWRAGLSLSHSERAPSVDELFSKGPHGGSQQFLIGDPDLSKEVSNGAELTLRRTVGTVHVQANVYYSRFSNFIYKAPTGEIADDLPVYRSAEGKARYYGFELEADTKFGRAMGIEWGGEMVADATRATIRDFGPAPLIPPLRVSGAITGSRGSVDGRIEVERVTAQRRNAPNETETPGYTMVNAAFDWHPKLGDKSLTLSLQANNLFDVDARRAASVLKDYAPLAGRDIRLTARLSF